jgi:hypothetical protein
MGLLAYDPDRVTLLRHRLSAAADELRTLRSTDPAAQDTMRSVARIRSDLELAWLPLLSRILDSKALTERWWRPFTGALEFSLITVMANGYGWSVQPDPLHDDTATVTAAEARSLGAMLNTADLVSLVDDRDQLKWLTQQLAIIGRDPALSANFLANFDSWPTLTYVLGGEHARTNRADITAVFDGAMSIWAHTLPSDARSAGKSATLASLLPQVDDVDLYVQALMVRSLHLDALTLATVAHELLVRWLALKADLSARVTFDRLPGTGPNAADLLLSLLLDDPTACVWFTRLAAQHPAVLFETLNDPDLAYQVVLIGTDPANTTVTAAGRALLAILDYFDVDPYTRRGFDTDGHPGEYGPFLGGLVAPWLLQFTMNNNDWDAPVNKKTALLGVALRDEQAMTRLIADAERIRTGFNESLSPHDMSAAAQVGGLLNLLLQLSVNEQVSDEIASTDERLNLLWTVVGVASSFLPGGPLVGIGTSIAITIASNKVAEYLDQPDPTGVRRTAERTMDVALALAGADAVARLHRLWVSDGLIAAAHRAPPQVDMGGDGSSCPSAEYRVAFDEWRRDLPGGVDGELARQATELLDAFVSQSSAQSSCAEIVG